MLRRAFRLWRSHPIALAALVGALFGVSKAVDIEIGALLHRSSGGVVPLLWSSSTVHAGGVNVLQTAVLLLIEVAANVLVFAALFAFPVALAVGIRRSLKNKDERANDMIHPPDYR